VTVKVRGAESAFFNFTIRNSGGAPGSAIVSWGLGDRHWLHTGYLGEWVWRPAAQLVEAVTLNPGETRNFRVELPIDPTFSLRSYAARVALVEINGDLIAEAVLHEAVNVIGRVAEPSPVTPFVVPPPPDFKVPPEFFAPAPEPPFVDPDSRFFVPPPPPPPPPPTPFVDPDSRFFVPAPESPTTVAPKFRSDDPYLAHELARLAEL